MSSYDVAAVRALYPALADGWAYLDGAAGTQVPRSVAHAVASAWGAGIGNHGGAFAASRRSDAHTDAARAAVADLVNAPDPRGVVLGPNTTTLMYRLAATLADTWRPGDEVVLTRLDHDANVRPWVQAAARVGAVVRWADPVRPSLDLPATVVTDLLSDRTRLVAVTAASNVVGTRPDVRTIAAAAHTVGAVVVVDAVHAVPHGPVDVAALGADVLATSAYKWSGPHLGALVADPAFWEPLRPDKLASAPDEVPWRFETGTHPFAEHAGLAAAVDHLAALLPGQDPALPRRDRLRASMAAVQRHEDSAFAAMLAGLEAMEHVTRIGSPADRTATVYITVRGHAPEQVAEHCARARVNVWAGHMYAWELTGLLGIRDAGSAVRAGLVHYNDRTDVDRLLGALDDLA